MKLQRPRAGPWSRTPLRRIADRQLGRSRIQPIDVDRIQPQIIDQQKPVIRRNRYPMRMRPLLALDPSGRWLLVANQGSDNIAVLSRDVRTGQLAAGKSFSLSRPQCLVFA